jgi:hypothetical protein
LLLQLYLAKKPLFAATLVELERGSMVMGRQFRFLFFTADAEHEGNWARDGMAPGDIARGTDAVQPDRDFRLRCIEGKIKGLRGYERAQECRAENLTELTGQVHRTFSSLSSKNWHGTNLFRVEGINLSPRSLRRQENLFMKATYQWDSAGNHP